ncbi:MAG TPA: glycosyltransferase [Arachnia sp.]|nr:glycosyltransferase [Arachnia sp.]HMT85099.1 glycosyltransferase [Arachnia sp.]
MTPTDARPTVGVVLVSMGNRPTELAKALETLAAQRGVALDAVLVGNGWEPTGIPEWVRPIFSPENLGCPEGRNLGARHVGGEFLFFYDDDAFLPEDDVLLRMTQRFDPSVAVVQPRGIDPDGKPTPRRWVPRLWGMRPGRAAVFWEALSMFRHSAFDQVGGWPGEFFFGHEGVDIAMRLLDAGWEIEYAPDIEACHPATAAARHDSHYFHTARNRVWVARRNLPLPLLVAYLGVWMAATVVRSPRRDALRSWFKGFRAGWATRPSGGRHPISWKTVWTMTRLGRPPLW